MSDDENGRRWIEVVPKRKRRNSPRALRFGSIKVGDQLKIAPRNGWHRGLPIYCVVTDLWFDPVEGQDDPVKGQMVGYSHIKEDGSLSRKSSTTVRGLASQQFVYADIDYISLCRARNEAKETGDVIGIGFGRVIRRRPKLSGL